MGVRKRVRVGGWLADWEPDYICMPLNHRTTSNEQLNIYSAACLPASRSHYPPCSSDYLNTPTLLTLVLYRPLTVSVPLSWSLQDKNQLVWVGTYFCLCSVRNHSITPGLRGIGDPDICSDQLLNPVI